MHSQSIRRIARNHRQLIAALLAGLAGLLIVSMLRPGPLPTTTIVVASHRLPAGHVLTNDDLTTREWPTSVGEPPPLVDVDAARGRTIAGPLDAGELVSPSRLVGPDLLAMGDTAAPPGDQATLVAAPVRLADPGQATLLRAGDVVDVIAARASDGGGQSASLVARGVRVVTIAAEATSKGGLLPNSESALGESADSSSLIVVAVTPAVATELAAAATRSKISVVIRPQLPARGS